MTSWPKENRVDIAVKIVLFILSPFFSFLYSLHNMKTKSSYLIFFLTAIIFGLSFTVPSGKTAINRADGASYRENFEFYKYVDLNEYIEGFKKYVNFEDDGAKDYYFDTTAFFVSRVTDNYHVMFMIFAIIFAYFSLKSFKFLTSEYNFKTSLACFILAYLFMINQIFNINGMRFWTAAWVAVYSIFQIFRNGNKRYFLLALLTPFIHGSYWIFIGILTIGYFLKRFKKIWLVLFFISFFVSTISVEFVRNMIDSLPPFLAKMAISYTDPEYITERNASGTGFSWVEDLFNILVKLYINLMVFLFIKNSKLILNNSNTSNLYSFLLVLMSFVNFTMPIPSVGGRFIMLSYPLISYIWLVNFKGYKYKIFLYIAPFIFLFSIYEQIILYIMVLEPNFLISSPFYLIYKYLIA